jgi:hypothetical protein
MVELVYLIKGMPAAFWNILTEADRPHRITCLYQKQLAFVQPGSGVNQ